MVAPSPSPVAQGPQSAACAKGPRAPSNPSPGGEKKNKYRGKKYKKVYCKLLQ